MTYGVKRPEESIWTNLPKMRAQFPDLAKSLISLRDGGYCLGGFSSFTHYCESCGVNERFARALIVAYDAGDFSDFTLLNLARIAVGDEPIDPDAQS